MNSGGGSNKIVWYKSLAFTIVLWFLPLSIMSMLVISYDSNSESIKSLKQYADYEIRQSSLFISKFIKNWFYYREIDIKNWSKQSSNVELLSKLVYGFNHSSKSLHEYTESDSYRKIRDKGGKDLYTISQQYDYIYDIFLIDKKGNILFSMERESDLGTNLFTGSFSKTKFASAFKQTLKDKKVHFSDLESYEITNSFLSAPLVKDGNLIGAFVIQLNLDTIYSVFEDEKYEDKVFTHYLVGSNGFLRSKILSDSEILKLKISAEVFDVNVDKSNHIFSYTNPVGYEVFGTYTNIDILGVKWALFSESNIEYIEAVTTKLQKKAILYFLIIMFIVIIISYLISMRIVRPVKLLSDSIFKFTSGKRDIVVGVNSVGEIGALEDRFKKMVDAIKDNENELIAQKEEAHKAFHELDEQKFALNAHSIVAITDVKGTISYVNDKFTEISGYTREELLGQNHRILNSKVHDESFWKDMYALISHGKIWHNKVCNVAKDGELYWVDTTIVPFMDENDKPKSYIVIRTDITEQKLLQESLIEAKELAEDSVKAKSEFLASMSHEIRTPMNGVIGMLGLLMNTNLDKSQKHQVYLAKSSAMALLALINDILDFSKVEAGKLDLDNIDFNIRKELGDFAEAIAYRAQEKGIELVLDVVDIDITTVNTDAGRLRQILNNIVGNSIKFTSKGHIFIKASLRVEEENSARLSFKIIDTGIGIPENKIDILFDSFSQVDASTTRKYGGTGLGLAIVKKLCELMGGSVSITSKLGIGSTFEFNIKVGLGKKSVPVFPKTPIKDKKVLIVDDSKLHTDMLSLQLQHWGMKVHIVSSSAEALEIIDSSFDIVYIDKDIKELSAEELADRFKSSEQLSSIKLVIMTSVSDRGDINTYIKHGYNAYFPKPATTDDIFQSLNILAKDASDLQSVEIVSDKVEDKSLFNFSKDTKILLVDDNKVNQLVANGLLEELGLEADVANNGLEALDAIQKAKDEPYNIILMDCQMPIMDGYEATKKIKAGDAGKESINIPVIAMTANAMDGDKEKCFASGMDDYISKPINPEILEAKLKKYLLKDV